jgi:hypothetical protein
MQKRWFSLLLMGLLIAGMVGCAATTQPYEYHDDRDEKPGPGLFSGDEGGFVINGEASNQPTDEQTTAVENAQPGKDAQ